MKVIIFLILISQIISAQVWFNINPSYNPNGDFVLYYSSFVEDNFGWFLDPKSGSVYRTTNGGNIWNLQINFTSAYNVKPRNILFIDKSNGWLLAADSLEKPIILFTTDSGFNWNPYSSPRIVGIYFFDQNKGIGAGPDGIFYTENGGVNWVKSQYKTFSPEIGSVSKIFFLDSLNGFMACIQGGWSEGYGYFFSTTDGGKSWEYNYLSGPPVGNSDIFFIDKMNGYCAASLSGFYKTLDGGYHWTRISSTPTYKIMFLSRDVGWATNTISGIVCTIDGGYTWFTVEPSTFNFGRFHYKKGNDKIYITGLSKTFFYSNSIVSVKDGSNSQNIKSFYIFQNYPNPFNPTTTIKYSIPNVEKRQGASLHVLLKVYDMLGREVATLVNEEKSPGYYEVKFDGSDLTSGVYCYRLITDKFAQTKKMMLQK